MPHPPRPHGLWLSSLTPRHMAAQKRLNDIAWDATTHALVWHEGRSGHGLILALFPGCEAPHEMNPVRSARARVGYGGGDMTAARGHLYYCSEGRIYAQALRDGTERPITPSFGEPSSPTVSPDGRWLLYVHSAEGTDAIALVDTAGQWWPTNLIHGHDFYMQPVWHPDSRHLAWIAWDHPQMPWDGTYLYLGHLSEASQGLPILESAHVIAGDAQTSIFQPTFSPDGRYLAYVSDVSGWYNLFLYDLTTDTHHCLVSDEAELGAPAWVQGMRTYAWEPESRAIYYVRSSQGFQQLWKVDIASRHAERVAGLEEYTSFSQPAISPTGSLAVIASGPTIPPRILVVEPLTRETHVMARSTSETLLPENLAKPQALEWPSPGGEPTYGLYYTPVGEAPNGTTAPPLIVLVHGGPTSQSTAAYNAQIQFLTTRGYAILAVNYRGSSGYGRAYRDALRGQWGLYDIQDAVSGAAFLAQAGHVDANRMVIMGGSAGGYTALQALAQHPGFFKAGVCLYGVTNLFTLAADTHKFEQHYLDSLIGPLPEAAARYRERSPIFNADRIRDPLILFQGEEDNVVPKEQAEAIVEALRRNGVPHEYHLYPGEGHGWRKAETIEHFYQALESFLRRYVIYA